MYIAYIYSLYIYIYREREGEIEREIKISKAYASPAPREMSATDGESVFGLSSLNSPAATGSRSSSHHRATYESSPSYSSHSHTHSSSSQLSSSASSSRRNGGVLDVRINTDPPSSSTAAGGSAHTTDTTILSAGRGKKRPTADPNAYTSKLNSTVEDGKKRLRAGLSEARPPVPTTI